MKDEPIGTTSYPSSQADSKILMYFGVADMMSEPLKLGWS